MVEQVPSDYFLRSILDLCNDAIIVTDPEVKIVGWNPAAERIFGYQPEEMLGRHVSVLVPDHLRDELAWIHSQLWSGQFLRNFETVRLKKDGTPLDVSLTLSAFPARDGTIAGMYSLARDISGRKRAERELNARQQVLTQVLNNSPVVFLAFDKAGRIELVAGRSIAALPVRLEVGANILDVFPPTGHFAECARRALAGEEVRHLFRGPTYALETHFRPVFAANGDVTGVTGVAVDVLDRERTAELETRARIAEEKQRSEENLLGMVSHELRTPLAILTGHLSTLLESRRLKADERRSFITRAREIAAQVDRLAGDLYTLSALGAEMLPLSRCHVDLRGLLRRSIDDYLVARPDRLVNLRLPFEALTVEADPARLEEVIRNVIDNATKYSPEGSAIEAWAEKGAGVATVRVRDHGRGVPPQLLEEIFQPFRRILTAGEPPVEGSGLGLAICRRIILAHGGSIWAEPAEGGGLLVSFSLALVSGGEP